MSLGLLPFCPCSSISLSPFDGHLSPKSHKEAYTQSNKESDEAAYQAYLACSWKYLNSDRYILNPAGGSTVRVRTVEVCPYGVGAIAISYPRKREGAINTCGENG